MPFAGGLRRLGAMHAVGKNAGRSQRRKTGAASRTGKDVETRMQCRKLVGAVFAMVCWTLAFVSHASAGPIPPCMGAGSTIEPAYGGPGTGPQIGTWTDITLNVGGACPDVLNGPARMVVALSNRFVHDGDVEDLAARVGTVSALEGLRYWSVTAGAWRTLISQSHAVEDLATRQRRSDFSPLEVMSGRPLLMVQRDTRSTGRNGYSLSAAVPTEDQLVVTIVNQTDIRLLLATLFARETLISVHFFTRLGGNEWGYYSLTVVKPGGTGGRAASFINRAAAFERFLTGRQPDAEPPVTP